MKKINIIQLIFSILLSITIHLGMVIEEDVNYFINNFHVDLFFILKVIISSIFIYLFIRELFYWLDQIPFRKRKIDLSQKKIVLIFLSILIMAIIYLIIFYPAVYLNDTPFMLYSPIHRGHPVIYGIFMSILFFSLIPLVGSTVAVFIMSIMQAVLASIILTYVIVWFHRKFNHKILTILLICYYVFFLIVTCYNVALNKDSPFSLMILLLFVFIYEIADTKGKVLAEKKFLFKLLFVSCLAMYIRNNGFHLVFSTLIVVFAVYGFKKYRKQCIIMLISILLLSFVPSIVVNLLHGDRLKREWYAVPIQQVCYVVKYHPERLTDDDYKVLSKFIKNPKKTIYDNYDVYTVDMIKYNKNFDYYKFNRYSKEFLLLWIRKFPSNISSYTKSYLLNTYHMWFVHKLDKSQSVFASTTTIGVALDKQIYHKELFPRNIQEKLVSFYYNHCTYLNPAGCFVLLIVVVLYALERKKKEVLMISSPLILLWFILMLVSPYSSALRYMAPYIYILPIIMLYTFKITRKDDKNELFKKSKK